MSSKLHKNALIAFLSVFAFVSGYASEETNACTSCNAWMRRAVYDVTGGSIFVLVADVNTKTHDIHKLYTAKADVNFRKDLAKNPDKKEFSPEIQQAALAALQQLQVDAARFLPQQSVLVASETFRMTSNGEKMLADITQACQMPFYILSQQERGHLEFLSAVANSRADADRTVVIDTCSAHAHITALNDAEQLISFGQKLGYRSIDDILAKKVRQLSVTPADINPVQIDEAIVVIYDIAQQLRTMPEVLKAKLAAENACVIATFSPIAGENSWKQEDSWKFLQEAILNRNSPDPNAPLLTSRALLMHALVQEFNVQECRLIGTDLLEGSTAGVMVAHRYW